MKIAISTLLITFSSIAFSQSNYLEVKQDFLSDSQSFGSWEISTHKSKLDKSLSESLKNNVLNSSEPYYISNINEIQSLIDSEKSKYQPSLNLSLNTFKGSKPLNVSIDRMSNHQGREILRGKVDGFADSQVKLVVYNGQMSGRITLSNNQKIMVIRSMDGGMTAHYEVDTSDITYD